MTRPSQRGFSLIEALVALIIAAMALASVLELQRQLADGQARYQRALDLAAYEHNAIALTASMNPTDQPRGEAPLAAGRSLRWQADPIGPPAINSGSRTAGRRFELQLYRLSIWIFDARGAPLGQFAYDRVGWRKLVAPLPYVPPPAPTPPTPRPALPTMSGPAPTGPVL